MVNRFGLTLVLILVTALGLSGCLGLRTETPTPIMPAPVTATVPSVVPTGRATPDALPPTTVATVTALPSVQPTPPAAPTATVVPPAPTPDRTSDNVFATILGPAAAPPDWSVRPCEGNGPLLCILAGTEVVGHIELSIWHLETYPALQALLTQHGLTPGAIDARNPEHAPKIAAAMPGFVDQTHAVIERDRQTTYGDTRIYTRLATQTAQVGTLPGVRYGQLLTDQAGTVRERYLSFAAFDGTLLYLLVPHYDPNSYFSFRSDDDLQRVEPYLPALLAGLRLPLPVATTSVSAVVTQAGLPVPVPLFRVYAVGSTPVAELPPGQTLQVTGQSPNGQWWRVVCPDDQLGECWVSADPTRTTPTTPE